MIYQIVSAQTFIRALSQDFTPCAAEALYNWYSELSESDTSGIEFDPVAIRCEWSEYEREALGDFDHLIPFDPEASVDENIEAIISELETRTTVIHLDNDNILIVDF